MLNIAEALVQTRGFNTCSYADIARAAGTRKASLHQYFATKADLGVVLVARYRSDFLDTSPQRYSQPPKEHNNGQLPVGKMLLISHMLIRRHQGCVALVFGHIE